MDDDAARAVTELSRLRDEIGGLTGGYSFSEEHTRWTLNVRNALSRYFGDDSDLARGFNGLDWSIPSGTIIHGASPAEIEQAKVGFRREAYREQLYTARGVLSAAVDRVEAGGLTIAKSIRPGLFDRTLGSLRRPAGASEANRRVFISHGGQPPMLAKVERIVRVLGFEPIIVSREASRGKAVDDLVPDAMRGCVCAIVLATKNEDEPDSKYPRPNVLHEIGLAQEILKERIIYLKESCLDFPSNVVPKVWEAFDADQAEPVWDKIVRELRGFDLIP